MDAKRCAQDAQLILEEELVPSLVRSIRTFEELGMLTSDLGLVVSLRDGSEFQLTVMMARAARG